MRYYLKERIVEFLVSYCPCVPFFCFSSLGVKLSIYILGIKSTWSICMFYTLGVKLPWCQIVPQYCNSTPKIQVVNTFDLMDPQHILFAILLIKLTLHEFCCSSW